MTTATSLNPSLMGGGEHSELEKPQNLVKEPDLTDPVVLELELRKAAHGVSKQAPTVQSASLVGGHPNPQFFFAQIEKVLLAASRMLKERCFPPPPIPAVTPAEPEKKSSEAAPATDVKKK